MKVLFCVRHNFYSSPGGAQIQILKTKEYLEKLGVECSLTTTSRGVDFCQYDIVHLTDLTWIYDLIEYLREIRRQNVDAKIVLSTIYWPFDDYAKNGAPFIQRVIYMMFGVNGFEFAKSIFKLISKRELIYFEGMKRKYISNQREIVQSVDLLLPNSEMEMQALNRRLSLRHKDYSVVNNAIDCHVFDKLIESNVVERNNNLITFVARIDPRKNQINFLKAMYDSPYKIRFIGNPGPNSIGYYNELKKLAFKRGNVEFLSHIPQGDVFKNMLESKVNVLTSWIETPGLVSLEAAYAGCNIVVTEKGSTKDYFGDFAFYCEPDSLDSIREQTDKAMNSAFDDGILDVIKKQYSWETAAEQTLRAYKYVLGVNNLRRNANTIA